MRAEAVLRGRLPPQRHATGYFKCERVICEIELRLTGSSARVHFRVGRTDRFRTSTRTTASPRDGESSACNFQRASEGCCFRLRPFFSERPKRVRKSKGGKNKHNPTATTRTAQEQRTSTDCRRGWQPAAETGRPPCGGGCTLLQPVVPTFVSFLLHSSPLYISAKGRRKGVVVVVFVLSPKQSVGWVAWWW